MALGRYLSVLKDESRQLGIREVRRAADADSFQAVEGSYEPNFGYTDAALWFHTTLDNGTSETEWLLELAFAPLDEVELFLVDKASGAPMAHYSTGDTLPFSERPLAHRHFVFPVTLAPHNSYELFLRVRSDGTVTAPLFIWKPSSFDLASRNSYMAIMLYFGLLLAFFTYNLRLYFSLHDRVYLYYLGFIAAITLGMGAWNGLFFEYLWPDSPRWGNLAAVVGYNLTGMFGAIFSRTFLNSRIYTPLLDRVMKYCTWMFALLVIASPLARYQQIAMMTSAVGILFSIAAVSSGVHCLHRGQRSARYFLVAWSLLLLGTAIFGARNFGLLPTNLFTRYAMQFGSAIEILLFSFALAERISDLRRGKELAEGAALAAKKSMVELLEHTEQELEQRVKERTHELTTLNNRLKEQELRLKGLAMYDPLTGLANRTLLYERIAEALTSAQQHSLKVALLLIDLDEFKPINDSLGHEVGDTVLQAIATRLQELVRTSDTVARLGGDEFVIVLSDLDDAIRAVAIGEKVIRELAQPMVVNGNTLQVSASVGVAFYPEDGSSIATLLRQADKAMYEAKRNGRNRIFLSIGCVTPETSDQVGMA
ncbi:MAG TPA: diguanylate cyclase [Gammaproteobacteria bacterium]